MLQQDFRRVLRLPCLVRENDHGHSHLLPQIPFQQYRPIDPQVRNEHDALVGMIMLPHNKISIIRHTQPPDVENEDINRAHHRLIPDLRRLRGMRVMIGTGEDATEQTARRHEADRVRIVKGATAVEVRA